ncbi:unnamed protein product [Brassica oleracea var. botrytis]
MDFKSLSRDISLHSLLYWVSSVESKSSHPMTAALVDYAKSVSAEPKPESVEDYQNFPGEGIHGKIDGKEVYIGNKRIASRAECSSVPDIGVDTKGGKTVGYVYLGETLAGVFNLSDACRSGVAQAMKELKSMGIKTAMLTGDNQASAMHAKEQLGNVMDVVNAELLPEGKSQIIKEFKREGPTAMVGDGLNDAPALATADIGISMGVSGSALATETGHIILMSNDIRRIPQAIRLARRGKRKVVENVVLSITMKGAILALAFAGHPLIWAAVLADVGTCLLVILNSMLLLRDTHVPGGKCHRVEKGEGDVVGDMEAGLLPKRGDEKHCKSGCCGKKNQEKVMKLDKTSEGHGHSGCCDKKQKDDVMIVGERCESRCCGDKKQPDQDEVKQSCHNEGGNLEEIRLDISVKGCCSRAGADPVVASLKVKSDGHCESSCCESSRKGNNEEACCEVETNESKCSSRERSHSHSHCHSHHHE